MECTTPGASQAKHIGNIQYIIIEKIDYVWLDLSLAAFCLNSYVTSKCQDFSTKHPSLCLYCHNADE